MTTSGLVFWNKHRMMFQLALTGRATELVFLGKILKQDDTLEASGIQSGMTVFAYPHHELEKPTCTLDMQDIPMIAFGTALVNPAFRTVASFKIRSL
ncbi:hypothetical protein HPB49_019907 [Dermacentor silvarum]|uniref:Uncharacterized protein n=1 Tax=Dermacentor silvarum TaxID=543639 RepID=A0ACB8CGY7_DERSI|nr:hypothetical protein HPB49_019907 [Dermacentor silvarum]